MKVTRTALAVMFLAAALVGCDDAPAESNEGNGGSITSGGGDGGSAIGSGGDGGMGAGGGGGGMGGAGGNEPSRMDIVVAVGWQGVRLLSIDEGNTWCETGVMVDGHDDLFRGAGYHDGLFVGAHAGEANRGAIWTTENGYAWTALHRTNEEPSLPENPSGQWYGGAAWGNGIWMAGGGCGRLATSVDGSTWTEVPRFTNGCTHIRSMAFHDGLFVAALDDQHWYASADGVNWSLHQKDAGTFVVALESGLSGQVEGANFYQGRGVCLAGIGSPNFGITRSEEPDCSGAVRVADTVHRPTTFLFGDAAIADFERGQTGDALADCLGLP